jgi:integrase
MPTPDLPVLPVEHAAELYLQEVMEAPTADTTKERTKAAIRAFIRFAAGYMPEDVPPQLILDALGALKGEGPRRTYSYWRSFYSWMQRRMGVSYLPLKEITPGSFIPPIRRTFRYFRPDQMDELRTTPDLSPFERMCVTVMHDTAGRPSDLHAIRTTEIAWAEKTIPVYRKKTHRPDVVRLADETLQALSYFLRVRPARGSEWLFDWRKVSNPGPPTTQVIGLAIRRAGAKAFYDRPELVRICSPLTLRHTAASDMVRSGLNNFEVAKLLGHSSTKYLERYVALIDADRERAANHYLEYLHARRGGAREVSKKRDSYIEGLDLNHARAMVRLDKKRRKSKRA